MLVKALVYTYYWPYIMAIVLIFFFFFLTNIFIQEIDVHNTVKTGVKVVP